jgi:hypothetical protein
MPDGKGYILLPKIWLWYCHKRCKIYVTVELLHYRGVHSSFLCSLSSLNGNVCCRLDSLKTRKKSYGSSPEICVGPEWRGSVCLSVCHCSGLWYRTFLTHGSQQTNCKLSYCNQNACGRIVTDMKFGTLCRSCFPGRFQIPLPEQKSFNIVNSELEILIFS